MVDFDSNYVYGLVYLAVPGIIGMVLSLLLLPIFWICRCCQCSCCCDCGQKTANCFCQDGDDSPSRPKKISVYVLVFIFTIPLFAFIVVGLSGNASVSKGVNDLGDHVQATIDDIQSTVRITTSEMNVVQGGQLVAQNFGQLQAGVDSTASQITDGKSLVLKYDSYREIALGIGFGAPLVGIVITIICYFAKAKPKQFVIFVYSFAALNSFFLWGSFAAHLPASKALTDVCDVLDTYLNTTGNSALRSCLGTDAYLPAFQLVESDIIQSLNSINNTVSRYGIHMNTTTPVVDAAVESSVQTLATFVDNQIATVQAQLNLLPADVRGNVSIQLNNLNTTVDVSLRLSHLASCQYLQDLFDSLKNDICSPLTHGLKLIAISDVICAVFLWPSTVLIIAALHYLSLSQQSGASNSGVPMTSAAMS